MIVNSIVVKIASRCNLNCSYCYVYNLGDNTYLKQPKLMNYNNVDSLILKVLEHCQNNNLNNFQFIFHGGEPLLQKEDFFTYFISEANRVIASKKIQCFYSLQTNGILLNEKWCKLFNELNIQIGISLDGYKEINDKYRVDHKGNGSYDNVVKGLQIGQKFLNNKPGLLSVMDIESDPVKFYTNLKNLDIKHFDLLWPHATHDIQPNIENLTKEDPKTPNTFYANWLIKIFEIWYAEKNKTKIRITVFDTIIDLILGKEYASNEDLGLSDVGLLVIETNGDIEVVGALKICGNGFTKSGANIKNHTFSDALETKLAKVYYNSHKLLPVKCTKCPIVDICGGGHIHTRFSKLNGFNNTSVYCNDFLKLITHIQNTIFDSLPKKYQNDFDKITYDDLNTYFNEINFSLTETPQYIDELSSF